MAATFTINRRALVAEIAASEALLKNTMDGVVRENFFDPAAQQMQEDFLTHPVTQEIGGGIGAPNVSDTLQGNFPEGGGYSQANLTSFIGFDESPEDVLSPIEDRLDPNNPDGPKLTYVNRDSNKIAYRYKISAPNEEAIYAKTPLPWAKGISWAKRIEQGLPGAGQFLNKEGKPTSRSGGGIQVERKLRDARFKPVSYLSKIFNNFLRNAVGLKSNGKTVKNI